MTRSNTNTSFNENTSLNARIKRRNKVGFLGKGNHTECNPSSGYGSYKEYEKLYSKQGSQTHHQNLVNRARKSWTKHPGSKKDSTLAQYK